MREEDKIGLDGLRARSNGVMRRRRRGWKPGKMEGNVEKEGRRKGSLLFSGFQHVTPVQCRDKNVQCQCIMLQVFNETIIKHANEEVLSPSMYY